MKKIENIVTVPSTGSGTDSTGSGTDSTGSGTGASVVELVETTEDEG